MTTKMTLTLGSATIVLEDDGGVTPLQIPVGDQRAAEPTVATVTPEPTPTPTVRKPKAVRKSATSTAKRTPRNPAVAEMSGAEAMRKVRDHVTAGERDAAIALCEARGWDPVKTDKRLAAPAPKAKPARKAATPKADAPTTPKAPRKARKAAKRAPAAAAPKANSAEGDGAPSATPKRSVATPKVRDRKAATSKAPKAPKAKPVRPVDQGPIGETIAAPETPKARKARETAADVRDDASTIVITPAAELVGMIASGQAKRAYGLLRALDDAQAADVMAGAITLDETPGLADETAEAVGTLIEMLDALTGGQPVEV